MTIKFVWFGDNPALPQENVIRSGFISELERSPDPRGLKGGVVKIILAEDDLHLMVTGTACSRNDKALFTLTYSLNSPNIYSCRYS